MKYSIGIIVLGGHVQGLGITRIFGRNNVPVIVLDKNRMNLAKHSKYCKKFFKYDKLIDRLLTLGEEGKFKDWLLMPTGDEEVGEISKNKTLLSRYFKVATADEKIIQNFYNKRISYELVDKLKVPFPKSWMPNSWEELKKMDISFPCIIKPAVVHTFYKESGKKVFVCNDINELQSSYMRAVSIIPKDEIIIQDIIPGNGEDQYSVCFMFDGKKPLVTLTARRARQHPPDFGNATTYAETVSVTEILEYSNKILRAVNFIGVCEVEFKFDNRSGEYKFLEVNPRTWKWHAMAEKSDSPILMSLYHFIYNLEPIIKNTQKEASFRHLITDIPTMIKMKLLKQKYPKTRFNTQYAVWNGDDILPGIFELIYLPFLIISR